LHIRSRAVFSHECSQWLDGSSFVETVVHWVGYASQMVDDIESLSQRHMEGGEESIEQYYHAKYD
jgi:hypothetical protein